MIRQLKTLGKSQSADEMPLKASHVIDNLIITYQRKSLAAERSEKVYCCVICSQLLQNTGCLA